MIQSLSDSLGPEDILSANIIGHILIEIVLLNHSGQVVILSLVLKLHFVPIYLVLKLIFLLQAVDGRSKNIGNLAPNLAFVFDPTLD